MATRALLAVLLLATSASAESFKAWAARASREEREKDDKAALMSYSSALSTWKPTDGKPARAKVLCARAALRDRSGDEAGALEDFTDCLELDKKNAKAFHRRGQLRFKQGKTSLAIDDYYKATALDMRFGAAYLDRAAAYEKQGDRAFAGEDYKHACDLGVKAACRKAQELSPARKRPSSKKKLHDIVIRIGDGAGSHRHSQRVTTGRMAEFSGAPDGGGDMKMSVTATLKPAGSSFQLDLLAGLDRADRSWNFQLMTVLDIRPGESVTALTCGDVRVDVALDGDPGDSASRNAEESPGGPGNCRLVADLDAPSGPRRCRLILKPGEQGQTVNGTIRDGKHFDYLLDAILSKARGNQFDLKYRVEQTPLVLVSQATLTAGQPRSVPAGDGKLSLMLEDLSGEQGGETAEPDRAPIAPEPPSSRGAPLTHSPKFKDCLSSLDACVQTGDSFGECVGKAPTCEQKSVKGCCPGTCINSFRKALDRGVSEAAAYREVFIPEATCAAPPKADDDE